MNRNLLRKIHRWIFIWMGVIMLAWVVSAIAMLTPDKLFGGETRHDRPAVDYGQARLSPVDAVKYAREYSGSTKTLQRVEMRAIDGRVLYKVVFQDWGTSLIDAASGELFTFTPELAEKITRRNYSIETPLLESTRLAEHDSTYPFGSLPVYRVRFKDNSSSAYFVDENSLRIFRSSPLSRVRGAIASLHEFEPIKIVTGSNTLRYYSLLAASFVALIGTIAGIMLTLPKRKRAR